MHTERRFGFDVLKGRRAGTEVLTTLPKTAMI